MSELLEQRIEAAAREIASYRFRLHLPRASEGRRLKQVEAGWRGYAEEVRAALLASDAVLAQAGMVVVPEAVLTWLNGEGPDLDGYEFENRPDMPYGHRLWWRSVLRRWIDAFANPGDGERDG